MGSRPPGPGFQRAPAPGQPPRRRHPRRVVLGGVDAPRLRSPYQLHLAPPLRGNGCGSRTRFTLSSGRSFRWSNPTGGGIRIASSSMTIVGR